MILLIVNNKQYAQLESIEDRYKLMSDKRAHVYIFDEYSEVVINFFYIHMYKKHMLCIVVVFEYS